MSAFEPTPVLTELLASPLLFLLRRLYSLLRFLRSPPLTRTSSQHPIRIVCISDTHTLELDRVEPVDLLIHAGDLTNNGTPHEIQEAVNWLKSLPHAQKVVIAGNHDTWFDENTRPFLSDARNERMQEDEKSEDHSVHQTAGGGEGGVIDWGDIHYLQNTDISLTFPPPANDSNNNNYNNFKPRTLKIHGAPQIPQLDPSPRSVHAFQYPSPHNFSSNPTPSIPATVPFSDIPPDTDILVTHSPPHHHCDNFPYALGCRHLLHAVWNVKPLLHVFGHVHAGRGVEKVYYDKAQRVFENLCDIREEGQMEVVWKKGHKGLWWWVFQRRAVLRDCFSLRMWEGIWNVVGVGIQEILWTRVWGGAGSLGREGWMVNAACMEDRTGRLRGSGIVVEV